MYVGQLFVFFPADQTLTVTEVMSGISWHHKHQETAFIVYYHDYTPLKEK